MKRIRRILPCFVTGLAASLLLACGPVIQDHSVRPVTSLGAGWYHEGKSSEEILHDYESCESLQRQNDNDPFVKNDCMKQKGYILK